MQSFKEIAYDVLKKAKKPMHVSDLTEEVRKVRSMTGDTPEKTINNACQKHDNIIRVGRGTFQAVK
ncbi:hypothetical protein D1BOALGB6SA_10313 [Olavius sp. associated proteobacterium Delta 1]|nr:hypothetical protein D1BOALGB6SA_10313 [Olavius sp. associated proteobacterium Delta 1]